MIDTKCHPDLDLTLFTGTGTVRTEEVKRAMEEMYAGTPTKLVLWDFLAADIGAIDFEGVTEIAELAVRLGAARQGGRTAIVTDKQVVLGITRVYESLAGAGAPIRQLVCATVEEALDFLGLEDLPRQ